MRLLRPLPDPLPGEPDTRSPARFIWWLCRNQWRTLLLAGTFGTVWLAAIGALPGAIGAGIDKGLSRDTGALWLWSGVIVGLAAVIAMSGILRHRQATHNFLQGAYRTVQLVTRHATRVGSALPKHIATGEVVSVGGFDTLAIGVFMDILGRTVGSIIVFVAVAGVLLSISPLLGAVILVGLPIQALIVGPLLRPLQRREHDYRHQQGMLTSRANDIVSGLRVLRGVGGEQLFAQRYTERSAQVRRHGLQVAATGAVMHGLQRLLPGLLLLAVTWIGAHAAAVQDITVGQLVAVFGYTTFLAMPMDTFLETARKYTTAHAAARRIVRLLAIKPLIDDGGTQPFPDEFSTLEDPGTGLRVPAGTLTVVACTRDYDAQLICDRLTRHCDSHAQVDGVALRHMPLALVRERIMLCDNDAHFFAGRLRDQLDVSGTHDDAALREAVAVAVAEDAVDSLGGFDGELDTNARNVSGGQRQRLRLVRALLCQPQILVLADPTSAVDAHTEALIAARLSQYRHGETTVVTSSSPLLLEAADQVCLVDNTQVVASGTHRELLENDERYRRLVTREAAQVDSEVAA